MRKIGIGEAEKTQHVIVESLESNHSSRRIHPRREVASTPSYITEVMRESRKMVYDVE